MVWMWTYRSLYIVLNWPFSKFLYFARVYATLSDRLRAPARYPVKVMCVSARTHTHTIACKRIVFVYQNIYPYSNCWIKWVCVCALVDDGNSVRTFLENGNYMTESSRFHLPVKWKHAQPSYLESHSIPKIELPHAILVDGNMLKWNYIHIHWPLTWIRFTFITKWKWMNVLLFYIYWFKCWF